MTLKTEEKSWNEFWAKYWRIDHRRSTPRSFEWDRRLVDFVEAVCQLEPGSRVLDLACGGGDQAKIFAQKGYAVVGVDIAPSLVDFARQQFVQEGLHGTFVVGDIRDISYLAEFDACVLLGGSFGFFRPVGDQAVLASIGRALRPGGKAYITFYPVRTASSRQRTWDRIEGGWRLDETWFDAETSTQMSTVTIINRDGTIIQPKAEDGYHANDAIRCYTMPEMKAMLPSAGLDHVASYVSSDLSVPVNRPPAEAARDIVVARRQQ